MTSGVVAFTVALVACSGGNSQPPSQPGEVPGASVEAKGDVKADTPFSPARPGRSWFCRNIAFYESQKREMWRVAYCYSDLTDCNGIDGPAAQLDIVGTTTRIVGPCEEYPVAYCYVTKTGLKAYGAATYSLLNRCMVDVVMCRGERGRDEDAATDCFPAGNPHRN